MFPSLFIMLEDMGHRMLIDSLLPFPDCRCIVTSLMRGSCQVSTVIVQHLIHHHSAQTLNSYHQ